MGKKSAISGEYIIQIEDSGSVVVYRIYDNVLGSLREMAEAKGFEYDPKWTTRQFGSALIKEYGEGDEANIKDYVVTKRSNGSIETYRHYDNTKGALREVAEKVGFAYDPEWNTRQFGSKLVDFLNDGKGSEKAGNVSKPQKQEKDWKEGIGEDFIGIPLFDVDFVKIEWPVTDKVLKKLEKEKFYGCLGAVVAYLGDDEYGYDAVVFTGDTDDALSLAISEIKDRASKYVSCSNIELYISKDFNVYCTENNRWDLTGELARGIGVYTGSYMANDYEWSIGIPAIFHIKLLEEATFVISADGFWDGEFPDEWFDTLVKEAKSGNNIPL